MFKFAVAALFAGLSSAYDESRSVTSMYRLRALSSALHSHQKSQTDTIPMTGCASAVTDSINEMQEFIDDIPGAGFVLDHIFPGNDDTKQIMDMLNEIKTELDDMRAEMNEAWKEIMDYDGLLYCAN